MSVIFSRFFFILGIFFLSSDSSNASNSTSVLQSISEGFKGIYKDCSPSVVRIMTIQKTTISSDPFMDLFRQFMDPYGQDPNEEEEPNNPRSNRGNPKREFKQEGLGSGVIIDSSGYIITNNHVIGRSDEITVELQDGKKHKAKVIGTDPKTDLGLIKITASNLKPIKIGDSNKIDVGDLAFAIGSPFNLKYSFTFGVISAKGRSNLRIAEYEDFIQTDAAINPGNSGGPLLNLQGELIGINTAILSRTGASAGIGLAVPSNMVMDIVNQLKQHGTITRGWLGIQIQDMTEDMEEYYGRKTGALVNEVVEKGPADLGKIQSGDLIIEYDGKEVVDTVQLRNFAASTKPDTKVKVKIIRDRKEKTIELKVGKFPSSDQEIAIKESDGKAANPWGFEAKEIDEEQAARANIKLDSPKGVFITFIKQNSIAEKSGLEQYDQILKIEKNKIDSIKDLQKSIEENKNKKQVLFQINRGGAKQFLVLKKRD